MQKSIFDVEESPRSVPETRGRNWFAGFALHGSCTNAEPGEPFYV